MFSSPRHQSPKIVNSPCHQGPKTSRSPTFFSPQNLGFWPFKTATSLFLKATLMFHLGLNATTNPWVLGVNMVNKLCLGVTIAALNDWASSQKQ
ncbi:hypothetical protein ACFX1W_029747 [Malus domestica]